MNGIHKELPRLGEPAEYRPSPTTARNQNRTQLIGMVGKVISIEPNGARLLELDTIRVVFPGGQEIVAQRGEFVRRPQVIAPEPPVVPPDHEGVMDAIQALRAADAGMGKIMAEPGLNHYHMLGIQAARESARKAREFLGDSVTRGDEPAPTWDEVEAAPKPAPEVSRPRGIPFQKKEKSPTE